MGVYIQVLIDPYKIDQEQWEQAYEETLKLLDSAPLPLMDIAYGSETPPKYMVYTSRLRNDNERGVYWSVCGDKQTKQSGETFRMFRDIDHYRSDRDSDDHKQYPFIKKVLNRFSESTENQFPAVVFDSKTQGHAYHPYILAVGMWLEYRFPEAIFLCGDLNEVQCQNAAKYVNDIMDEDIPLPYCVTPRRVLSLLMDHFEGHRLLDHLFDLHRGENWDCLKAMFDIAPEDMVNQWFKNFLKEHVSVGTLGATGAFLDWFNAERDIDTLCQMGLSDADGPQYDPIKFTMSVCNTWVTTPLSKREVLTPLLRPEEDAQTIAGQFGGVFLDMSGAKGRYIQAYINKEDIIETLCKHCPEKAEQISKLVEARHEQILVEMVKVAKPFNDFADEMDEDKGFVSDGAELFEITRVKDMLFAHEMWFTRMAVNLQIFRKHLEKEDQAKHFFEADIPQLIDFMKRACEHNRILLTEEAWQWIENETDREVVYNALLMLTLPEREVKFWNSRNATLESQEICAWVTKKSYETFEDLPEELKG